MQSALDGEPGKYATLEYRLPDGSFVSTTIGAWAERIDAGAESAVRLETSSNCFQVHRGSGWTEVKSATGEEKFKLEWARGDSFVIPAWYEFVNHANDSEAAYLFYLNDKPMQNNLGLWRIEQQSRDDD
jgi:gentisate 1,2-dioxygenase